MASSLFLISHLGMSSWAQWLTEERPTEMQTGLLLWYLLTLQNERKTVKMMYQKNKLNFGYIPKEL